MELFLTGRVGELEELNSGTVSYREGRGTRRTQQWNCFTGHRHFKILCFCNNLVSVNNGLTLYWVDHNRASCPDYLT